jgi:hypothetical protein
MLPQTGPSACQVLRAACFIALIALRAARAG